MKPYMRVKPHTDEIVKRYTEGETLREIAESFGCSWISVRNALMRAGVERRPFGPRPGRRRVEEVRSARCAGEPMLLK